MMTKQKFYSYEVFHPTIQLYVIAFKLTYKIISSQSNAVYLERSRPTYVRAFVYSNLMLQSRETVIIYLK